MIEIELTNSKHTVECSACLKNNSKNSNIYEVSVFSNESFKNTFRLCNDCLKELRRKIVVREAKMTPKQRDYINFNRNKAEAHRKWLQQCELDAIEDRRENAGDRD